MSDAAAGGWRRELADLAAGRGTVAKLAGVRVSLHWTLPPFVAVLVFVWPAPYATRPWWALGEIVGIYTLIVLPHEVGHLLAAWSVGMRVREIVLWPLGGLALATAGERPTWRAAFWLAAAGPLVSLLLVPIFYGAWYELGYYRGGDVSTLLWRWSWFDAFVLVSNLLPIPPLDGGRMLHAALCGRLGTTRAGAATGAIGLALSAALAAASVRFFDPIALVFAGLFAWLNLGYLQQSLAVLRLRRRYGLSETAACPHCRRPAVEGPTHSCDACGLAGNAFLHAGRCWACGADAGDLTCPECGRPSAAGEWLAAT